MAEREWADCCCESRSVLAVDVIDDGGLFSCGLGDGLAEAE